MIAAAIEVMQATLLKADRTRQLGAFAVRLACPPARLAARPYIGMLRHTVASSIQHLERPQATLAMIAVCAAPQCNSFVKRQVPACPSNKSAFEREWQFEHKKPGTGRRSRFAIFLART